MKKVHLFAIVFLVGITAQANINSESTFDTPRWDRARYLSSQSVTFMEDGVQYEVLLNGNFTFDFAYYNTIVRNRGRRNYNANRRGAVVNQRISRRIERKRVFKDRYGVIHGIGNSDISYNNYGRVNKIGHVRLRYSKGKLMQVGNMQIIYNRRGRVARTIGHINGFNPINGVCGVAPVNFDAYQVTYNNPVYTGRRMRH